MNKKNEEHQEFCDEIMVKLAEIPHEAESEQERIAFVSNNHAIERAVLNNKEILSLLETTKDAVTDQCISIIDDMGSVFKTKAESISELRAWRKTIEQESKHIEFAIKRITDSLSKDKISALSEFVSLIERLNQIEPNAVIDRIFDNTSIIATQEPNRRAEVD